MNEELEREQHLGGLPEDIQHERKERPYRRGPLQHGVNDGVTLNQQLLVKENALKAQVEDTPTAALAPLPSNVQSVYDARPVNAIDSLFGGTIEMRVPA